MTLANRTEPLATPAGRTAPRRSWIAALLGRVASEDVGPVLPPPPRAGKKRAGDEVEPTVLAASPGAAPKDSPPKPASFVADLLFMNAVEEKAPTGVAGAGDVFDALVQDHLARATSRAPVPAVDEEVRAQRARAAILGDEKEEIPPALSPADACESAEALQREIQSLLAGDPSASAPAEPGTDVLDIETQADIDASLDAFDQLSGETPVVETVAGSAPSLAVDLTPAGKDRSAIPRRANDDETPPEQMDTGAHAEAAVDGRAGTSAAAVTPAELEVLLKDGEEAPGVAVSEKPRVSSDGADSGELHRRARDQEQAAKAGGGRGENVKPISFLERESPSQIAAMPVEASNEANAKISEADGVMAEERAQLVAGTNVEAPATAPTEALPQNAAAPAPGETIAGPVHPDLAAAVQSIMDNPVQMDGSASPAAAAALTEVSGNVAVEVESSAEAVPTQAISQPEATTEISAPDTSPDVAPRQPGLLSRLWNFLLDILLMLMQVVDMPFGWIKEPDKNILGIAAFCLLLGGTALYVWALWLVRH